MSVEDTEYNKSNPTGRYWATVLYEDSMPKDLFSILTDWCVPCFLIAHDPEDDSKKYHYHLMIMFPTNKRQNYVKKMISEINGVGCERIRDKIGYARYLIHKDNPEKKQYLPSDVFCFGGANYDLFITQGADETSDLKLLCEITSLISDNDIIFFKDLVSWAKDNNRLDILKFCMVRTNFIMAYMRSLEYSNRPIDK